MSEHHRGILHIEVANFEEALLEKIENAIREATGLEVCFDDPEAHPSYLGHKAILVEVDTQLYGMSPLEHLIESVAGVDNEGIIAVMWVDCDTYMGNYKFVYSNATPIVHAGVMRHAFLERVKENVLRIAATKIEGITVAVL